jgi:hypothetical protein
MSEAARLRAQKAYSTDPAYLERMALAEEERERSPRGEVQSKLNPKDTHRDGDRRSRQAWWAGSVNHRLRSMCGRSEN